MIDVGGIEHMGDISWGFPEITCVPVVLVLF